MGFLDKIKGLFRGKEPQVKSGIDTVSNTVEKKVGPEHAEKVDDLSEKAKDAVDDFTKSDAPGEPDAKAPPTPSDAEPG